jgi:hypothetical protein
MKGDMFIKFRDMEDVCVAYDVDFSGPGAGCGVEWWFSNLTAEESDGLNVTPAEDCAIADMCIAAAEGRDHYDDDCGGPCISLSADRDKSKPLGTPISQLSTRPGEPGYAEWLRISRSWGYD